MNVDIVIRERDGDRGFYIPWLPDEIEFGSGGTVVASYDIMNRGPAEVPTGSGLRWVRWKGTFPGINRPDDDMLRGSYLSPAVYHNILEDWRQKGTVLNVMVYCYPINMDVILSEYEATAKGAFGDLDYTIKLTEKRDLTLWPITPPAAETTTTTATPDTSAEPQRTTTTSRTYTIKKGDSPWRIAQQQLGNGQRWKEIIELNQEILEATAQKYGQHCTVNNPHIYAGTVISLPDK